MLAGARLSGALAMPQPHRFWLPNTGLKVRVIKKFFVQLDLVNK